MFSTYKFINTSNWSAHTEQLGNYIFEQKLQKKVNKNKKQIMCQNPRKSPSNLNKNFHPEWLKFSFQIFIRLIMKNRFFVPR